MLARSHFAGIVRARSAAAKNLIRAILSLETEFTEYALAERWLYYLNAQNVVFPFGWYQPPPKGVSVLIGEPSRYARLKYRSLRDPDNFPSEKYKFSREAVIYPYFSAIDRSTMMIGDHVATYYSGNNGNIREWIKLAYHTTKSIIKEVKCNMTFSDLYGCANVKIKELGACNNTFSIVGGLASDIGHSIPFFGRERSNVCTARNGELAIAIANAISPERKFINADNEKYIGNEAAFTIEPQIVIDGMPMASFHMIVVIIDNEVYVVEEFNELFDLFGMSDWIYSGRRLG